MINIPKLFGQGFVSSALRSALKVIPNTYVLNIMQGPLKGSKWIKGAGVNGYWLGSYEIDHQKTFQSKIKETSTFYDIGSHVGFFTLLASKCVGPRGQVYAFEPNPRNIYFLKEHLRLNKTQNVTLIEKAISNETGVLNFSDDLGSSMGKLDKNGTTKVEVTTIDTLVAQGLKPPQFMKIDVEGLQDQVILGAIETIKKYKPQIIVEADCRPSDPQNFYSLLSPLGYKIICLTGPELECAGDFYCYCD